MQEYEYKCNCWCLKYVLRKGPGTRQNLLRLRLVLLVFPEFCLPSFLLSLVSFFFSYTQTANSLVCLPQCSWPSPTLLGSQLFLLSDFTLHMYCLTSKVLSIKKQLICLLSSYFIDASGQDRRGDVSSSFIVPYTRSGFCLVVSLIFRGLAWIVYSNLANRHECWCRQTFRCSKLPR